MGFSIENIGSRSTLSQQKSQDSMKSLLSQEFDSSEKMATSEQSRFTHLGGETQNQGNVIGERPCVRQSKNGRIGLGGNSMKDILGQGHLKWEVEHAQGAYEGREVYKLSNPLDRSPAKEDS